MSQAVPTPCTAEPDCKDAAVAAYTWDWGERGTCCASHQTTTQQRAKSLKRGVTFVPLVGPSAPPLGHDERVKLNAEIISLREELAQAQEQGRVTYGDWQRAAEEGRRYASRNLDLEKQIGEARDQVTAITKERDEKGVELRETFTELQRIRALLPRTESIPPAERGSGRGPRT